MNWWHRFRTRDRLERELDAELRYHFDREVDDNIRMGMSQEEARRRARLDLGGDDQLKESCRDARRHLHAVTNPLDAMAVSGPDTARRSRRLQKG